MRRTTTALTKTAALKAKTCTRRPSVGFGGAAAKALKVMQ
jgi:hypothetical protein